MYKFRTVLTLSLFCNLFGQFPCVAENAPTADQNRITQSTVKLRKGILPNTQQDNKSVPHIADDGCGMLRDQNNLNSEKLFLYKSSNVSVADKVTNHLRPLGQLVLRNRSVQSIEFFDNNALTIGMIGRSLAEIEELLGRSQHTAASERFKLIAIRATRSEPVSSTVWLNAYFTKKKCVMYQLDSPDFDLFNWRTR
jgi:hypothetical protein